jgi:hypothetical protein
LIDTEQETYASKSCVEEDNDSTANSEDNEDIMYNDESSDRGDEDDDGRNGYGPRDETDESGIDDESMDEDS